MTRPPLSFGYLYDLRNPAEWQRDWHELYSETLDLIEWSETMGFQGAWIPEHHLAQDGYIPSPNLICAAIAARTKTLRMGSALSIAPLYDPVRFAEECAVLDILSGGRVEMALGLGYRRREYAAMGVPFQERGRRFDEFLEIVTRLLAGETVTFSGRYYTIEGACLAPPAPNGVPLYIGGFVDKALNRAIRYQAGYFGNADIFEGFTQRLANSGKANPITRMRIPGLFFMVADNPAEAMEELAPYYLHINTTYGEWGQEDNALGRDSNLGQMDLDTFRASGILQIVTPAEAIGYFRSLQDQVPIDHFMMARPPGLSAERFRHYATLFAQEVIPAFAE